ncbi:MAG TPA: enoyl-CoA hydratase/isomerase family protein [Dehalococcoidia bacterium]|nr:enoyl-CoA hydratase/isomerase family protein [Dehalococcoidia bacterium]
MRTEMRPLRQAEGVTRNMSFEMIKTDQVDRVAIVTLNRPEVLNALSLQLVRELDEFVTEAEQDDGVGAIIITGAGERAFSAGADIHENREFSEEERAAGAAARAEYTWHLAISSKPIIGAINGLCYGGGTVMATGLDFLMGCEKTSFRFLAVNYGQLNATWSLPTMVGWPKAKELLYSGREVFADEAYHIGLINHLVPSGELMDRSIEVAAGIAKNRPEGVANIKSLLIEHTGESLETQFRTEIEGRKGRFKGLTVEDGFKDFLERKGRKPRVS